YQTLISNVCLDLYLGDGDGAFTRLEENWVHIERGSFLRSELLCIETYSFRGAAAVLAALGSKAARRDDRLAIAHKAVQGLPRQAAPWGHALAQLLVGDIAHVRGDLEQALEAYTDAQRRFDNLDMALYAHVMRLVRGELMGGSEGERLRDEANQWM